MVNGAEWLMQSAKGKNLTAKRILNNVQREMTAKQVDEAKKHAEVIADALSGTEKIVETR